MAADGGVADKGDRFVGVVGYGDGVEVLRVYHILGDERPLHEFEHRFPESYAHEDDGEILDLAGLHKRGGLEHLVERTEPAGQDDEAVRVLHEHHLADEEVFELLADVQVMVRAFLLVEAYRAADGASAHVLRATARGLHDARAAAGHHGETDLSERTAHLHAHAIERALFRRAGGAEKSYAWADEMQRTEAADHRAEDVDSLQQFLPALVRPLQEATFRRDIPGPFFLSQYFTYYVHNPLFIILTVARLARGRYAYTYPYLNGCSERPAAVQSMY